MLETPPSLVLGRHRLQRRGRAWRLTPSCVGPVSGLQAPTGVTEGNHAVSLHLERACPLEKSYLDAFTPATARAELVRARNHAATREAAGGRWEDIYSHRSRAAVNARPRQAPGAALGMFIFYRKSSICCGRNGGGKRGQDGGFCLSYGVGSDALNWSIDSSRGNQL